MADVKDQEKSARKRAKADASAAFPAQPHPESHAALARKYRPKVFAELIGQDAMVRTLKNAFASGRIAQAYMLTGVRGVGKTTTARLIARALNYEAPGVEGPTLDMTEEGAHCRAILESRHLDVVDRALMDLTSVYRDAIAVAAGAPGDLVNEGRRHEITRLADGSSAELNLRRIGWIFEAREQMLEFNVPVPLALEAMMVALKVPEGRV